MSRSFIPALLLLSVGCVPAERSDAGRAATSDSPALSSVKPRPRLALTSASDASRAGLAARSDSERPELPVLVEVFKDDFERDELGDQYFATSAAYRIDKGKLCVKGAKNHPLWLRPRLPKNARIEVTAQTSASEGDIKLEAWGDGRGSATAAAYDNATSYIAIFGGWKNRYHVLARLDEHAPDRPEVVIEPGSDDPRQQPVLADKSYRLKLERSDGRTVRFWVDDVEILSFSDPSPLTGAGHDHFAFNNWQTPACFDNLTVAPLAG